MANLSATWSHFFAVPVMMVWVLNRGPIHKWQIWVQAGHTFWQCLWWWFECCFRDPTHKWQIWVQAGHKNDDESTATGVRQKVANLCASWSHFFQWLCYQKSDTSVMHEKCSKLFQCLHDFREVAWYSHARVTSVESQQKEGLTQITDWTRQWTDFGWI